MIHLFLGHGVTALVLGAAALNSSNALSPPPRDPRRPCCKYHLAADRDHRPVISEHLQEDCGRCGLAVTGLGERHGYYLQQDCGYYSETHPNWNEQEQDEGFRALVQSVLILVVGAVLLALAWQHLL